MVQLAIAIDDDDNNNTSSSSHHSHAPLEWCNNYEILDLNSIGKFIASNSFFG